MKTLPDLSGYHGSESFTQFSPVHRCLLTEGTLRVAEDCGAYWLFDLAASYLPYHDDYFATCTLKVTGSEAVAVLDDGNGNEFARQEIPLTDFPEGAFKFFCGRYGEGRDEWTFMLPSEY